MRLLLSITVLASVACSSAASTDAGLSSGDAETLDGAVGDVGRPDAGARDAGMRIDPSVYDCRAAASPPARVSPRPLACPVDPGCTGVRLASSHRGAGAPSVLAPENTLSGIRAAIAHGADLVEMDVRATSDGVLVLMHDADVMRTTSGTGLVSALTLAELRALTLRAETVRGDFACERVPTFREALDLAAGRIVIIVDASKLASPAPLVQALRDANAVERVVFDDDDVTKIQAALALEPGLRFLVRATTEAALTERLAALAPARPVYVHIDDADPAVMAGPVRARSLRVFALGFGQDLLAPTMPRAYEELYGAGADMVQSNRIDLLGAFLTR